MSRNNFSSRSIESRRSNNNRSSYSRSSAQLPSSKKKTIFVVAICCMLFFLYNYIRGAASISIPAGVYTIAAGDTPSTLNSSLNLGISNWRYKWYMKFFAPSDINIKAGTYETEEAMPLETFLVDGFKKTANVSNEQTIKLLPGWNIWDFDEYFAENNILPAGEFTKVATENFATFQKEYSFLDGATSLEGFLMPDTYRIYKNSSAENIIKKLLDNFKAKIASDYATLDSKTAYETLIMASIVEREERIAANRPIVAGILEKRVKEGIAMGADATVCYGFKKTFKECTPTFIASVITDHSNVYNTRKTLGYPPTPISSVSVSAWNAAFKPESSAYYYYLHDNDGVIHYAKTLAEHNANVQKYLR